MNILFLTQRLGQKSGWERYSLDIVSALRAKGVDGLVICADVAQPALQGTASIKQYALLPPALSSKRICFCSYLYAGSIIRALKTTGFVPDIIHCLNEPYAPITRSLARKLGRPYILMAHGSFAVRPFASPIYGFFQRLAYKDASGVVSISYYTEKRLRSYMPNVKTTIIPVGVNVGAIPEIAGQDAHKKPMMLGVGALKERKGFIYVLQALPKIIQNVPEARYIIVGNQSDTAYVDKLKDYVMENKLEQAVEFKQNIDDSELAELYKRAKVFVLTPVSLPFSFEGFGLVYLEANARGVPAIGSYGNGGEDAIKNGETGFLTKPGDPIDIAEKVITILKLSDSEHARYAARARAFAESLTWEKIAEKYLRLYHDCLS